MDNHILIQSIRSDLSTVDVLDWIYFLSDNKVSRINDSVSIDEFKLEVSNELNDISFKTKASHSFEFLNIDAFWYRRGDISFNSTAYHKATNELIKNISYNSFKEDGFVLNALNSMLSSTINRINSPIDNDTNKLINLLQAKESGIAIPHTLVTNKIKDLEDFIAKFSKVITKPIDFNRVRYVKDGKFLIEINCITKVIDQKYVEEQTLKYGELNGLPKVSLYQQYIEKKFELRIFYLDGACYSMAIFSQSNEKTKEDFRNYDYEKPNRTVAYQLPDNIMEKLSVFMKRINMNCGSIDMIYTPKGEFVFLEVNPVGQFQWLSKNCNFGIERQLALKLLKNGN